VSDRDPFEDRSIAAEPGLWIPRATLLTCLVALVAAETTAAVFSIQVSVACYAALLFVFLNLPLVLTPLQGAGRNALLALTLVPTVKIGAVVIPQRAVSAAYWEAFVAVLALVTVMALRRFVPGSPGGSGALQASLRGGWPTQLAIAAAGPVLALDAAAIFSTLDHAKPGLTTTAPSILASTALSGVALEIVFRGVVQRSIVRLFGPPLGVGLTSVVYAGAFAGSGSVFIVALALFTGLLWGVAAETTRTVKGVAASHGLFAMSWAILY
jgi:membrane protease YdiL (CAAX protease family)